MLRGFGDCGGNGFDRGERVQYNQARTKKAAGIFTEKGCAELKSEDFLQTLNGIDENFIESAGKDLERFRSEKSANSLSEKAHRKPVWKNAAACTAAAIFGVFALLLGTGRIKLETGAGVSLNASSGGLFFPISDDYQLDLSEETSGRITVNSAYGYAENSAKIGRFEIGEKFGETAEITDAKSTFLIINGNAILTEQELLLTEESRLHLPAKMDKIDVMTALGYPSFGDDFEFTIELLRGENAVDLPETGEVYARASEVQIFADYTSKTVRVQIKCSLAIIFTE